MQLDWSSIVEDIGPKLFRYFSAYVSDEQSSDLVQETLIRLVRKVGDGGFDANKGTLRMFAFGIAYYVRLEARQMRKYACLDEVENDKLLEPVSDIEEISIFKETFWQLQVAMKLLSETQQQILALLLDEEMTLQEISILLNLPLGTVKSHLFRSKQKLGLLMQKVEGGITNE